MKLFLDAQDPLPKLPDGWPAKRHWDEAFKEDASKSGEDWRPTQTPGVEANWKGQLRTKDYPLPEPPETDIPIPCVVEHAGFHIGDVVRYMGIHDSTWKLTGRSDFGGEDPLPLRKWV